MASVLTHAVVAAGAGRLATGRKMPARYWVGLIVVSVLPDADTIGFSLGVRYADVLGHRGFFHSLAFAAIAGGLAAALVFRERWWRWWPLFGLVAASHGVLDAATDGGLGVAFFAPIDPGRYFLPVTPLRVSPIGVAAFFSLRGLSVLTTEIVWVWLPLASLLLAAELVTRRWSKAA